MSNALDFQPLGEGLATLTFDLPEKSVNIFTREVFTELEAVMDRLASEPEIRCLVLLSGKPDNFIAGADVREIAQVTDPVEAEAGARMGQRAFAAWEKLPFPTVAAVRGTCVGGGTELALASDYIVLSDRPDLRIGLPETQLGILPGWGGSTRLPRKVGIAAALDIILAGKTIRPSKAFKIGLADALVPDASFGHLVREFARRVIDDPPARRTTGDFKTALLEKNPVGRKVLFDQARKQVLKKTGGHYPAPLRALEVVRTGIEDGPAAGFEAEARGIAELATSPTSKHLVHIFHLMEGVKKTARVKPPARPAVLGAGVMGGGIAQLIAYKADRAVRMKDIAPEPLSLGMAHASSLFRKMVDRRYLSRPASKRKMALLRPTLTYDGFEGVDFVVEAIVEKLEIKQKVFEEISRIVPEDAVLASNTSSLSIDAIGRDAHRPERVVGMHFFNPVHKMPLVEVIAGARTSARAVDAVVSLCQELGKTPVVVQDAPGFLVNRLLMFSMVEALALLEEGTSIDELDATMKNWGMPMGPIALTDEVGVDVAHHVAEILRAAFPDRLSVPAWLGEVAADGRLGAKVEKGFYRYEKGRRTEPDRAVYALIGKSTQGSGPSPEAIADRITLPMANEAARCLEERVVANAGDLDLAMILGTGFPPFRGGLCRWADTQGIAGIVEALDRLAKEVGDRFEPSKALREVASRGGFYAAYPGPVQEE